MTRRRGIGVALALLALGGAPGALADGDPASDVLNASDVYYPYAPHPSSVLRQRLDRMLRHARAHGHGMKVALIQSRGDLGAYPDKFGHPQSYAKLLWAELAFGKRKPHLLVVMPNGFGGSHLPKGWRRTLAAIHIDRKQKSDGLVRAALSAVPKLTSDSRQ